MNYEKPVVFFDGVCNLCSSIVQFIIKHDRKEKFLFCALQSEKAKMILNNLNYNISLTDTIVLYEKGMLFTRSTATLKIIRRMKGLYPLLYIFIIIPKPLRNYAYNLIAKKRYKWFGKKDSCMVPIPELQNRFIQ
jgi:predicted DCC family thiol-disulfide oxidoreductase YuxK